MQPKFKHKDSLLVHFATLSAVLIFACVTPFARSQALDVNKTVLTLSGNSNGSKKSDVEITLAALRKLPQKSITLKRSWERFPTTFNGPLLRDVINFYELNGQYLNARSLNQEEIKLSINYINEHDVIVAFNRSNTREGATKQSALFVVFPDSTVAVNNTTPTQVVPSKLTFQVRALHVE